MKKTPITLLLILLFSQISAEPNGKVPAVGEHAPLFMLQSTTNEWVSLRDFCGSLRNPWKNKKRLVVASFWATYCAPCKKEIPLLDALVARYKDEVKLLLISVDAEGGQVVGPHVKEAGYKAQILLDPYAKAAGNYGVKGVPALFLIDRAGILRYSCYGYREEAISELGQMIDSLMAPVEPAAPPVVQEMPKPDSGASIPEQDKSRSAD